MNSKIGQLLTNLNEQLNFTDLEIDNPIIRSENAINIIIKSIEKLKRYFDSNLDFYRYYLPYRK